MSAWGHCTDFAAACKPTESPLSRMLNQFASAASSPLVWFVWLNKINEMTEINQTDQINQMHHRC
jgi:hypothetical protein